MALDPLQAAGVKASVKVVDTVTTVIDNAAVSAEQAAAVNKTKIEVNVRTDDAQQYDQFRKPDSTKPGGEWDYAKHAPNDGAVPGSSTTTMAKVGEQLDRYGPTNRTYMAPADTPLEMRSMAPGAAANQYIKVEVAKPFEIVTEKIAPAFDQLGGGQQVRGRIPEIPNRFATLDELVDLGYLKPTK